MLTRNVRRALAVTAVVAAASTAVIWRSAPVAEATGGDVLLAGVITSASGEKLEGVPVSARAPGMSITTTVYTDRDGEYVFTDLQKRKYRVWAQAVGYELNRFDPDLSKSSGARHDFVMTPGELEKNLSGDAWFNSLPEGTDEEKRMKEVIRLGCRGCHDFSFMFRTKFDEKGWREIVRVMARIGNYGYDKRLRGNEKDPPEAKMDYFGDRLAAYLAKVRGPNGTMKLTPRPRPTGDSTLVVIREYDAPEPGYGLPLFADGSNWSLGGGDFMDHARHHVMNATLDHSGNVWISDTFNTTKSVSRVDGTTGKVTVFKVSTRQAGPNFDEQTASAEGDRAGTHSPGTQVANTHDIQTADDGTIWFDLSSTGALGRIDPKTNKLDVLRPPQGRVGSFMAVDGNGGVWTTGSGPSFAGMGGAWRYDLKTQKWQAFQNPIPKQGTYGLAGDKGGNGYWSMQTRDLIIKGNLATGKTEPIEIPRRRNSVLNLFTDAEKKVLTTGVANYQGRGQPEWHTPRKPGADRHGSMVYAPSWYGDLIVIDSQTGRVETHPYPVANSHGYEASVDKDGNAWVAFTYDDYVGKFDPKTKTWTRYDLPTRSVKTHGLQTVTINGRTQIGMGYLGIGKAAKLEFRTQAEAAALKTKARALPQIR